MSKSFVGHYSSRMERAEFIAVNFSCCLAGRVLDVGCGEALLKDRAPSHTGIDVAGTPDVFADLDCGRLPFADDAFDTIVCIDVLEHVEPLAQVLVDLFRVSKRYVIVSLPNMYALGWRLRYLQGQVLAKEYSLTPRNRHKWLPSFAETRIFVRAHMPPGWHIAREFGYHPRAWWRVGSFYGLLLSRFPNVFATSYWGLFEYER